MTMVSSKTETSVESGSRLENTGPTGRTPPTTSMMPAVLVDFQQRISLGNGTTGINSMTASLKSVNKN
jgi:hypothetical protein